MEDQEAMVTKEKQQTTKMAILWTTFSEMGIARCSVLKCFTRNRIIFFDQFLRNKVRGAIITKQIYGILVSTRLY